MEVPEVRYAWSADTAIAYQVVGDGTVDLVVLPQFVQNLEWSWRHRSTLTTCGGWRRSRV